jgi:RNA 3'-terminal phosphate cyclase (ATP)
MREIDGSEGGGQILRSALALAAVTEIPVRVTGIRGNRPTPGLKPQHLTVVETLAEITDATVEGATQGAETIEFDPDSPRGGELTVEIGTAGSISLLFDAILPLATTLTEPLSVTATGGTEVKWSPPLVVHEHVKLPLCRRFGLHATIERNRTGFYPAGGGSATLHLQPTDLSALEAGERGELVSARCYSIVSADLVESEVGLRQAASASRQLESRGIEVQAEQISRVETRSTGSALAVELEYEHTRAGFDALGERGVPAEKIASRAVEEAVSFHRSDAAVDRHLGDQLLLFLALAGGELSVPSVTDHIATSLDLLEQFGFDWTRDESGTVPTISAPER